MARPQKHRCICSVPEVSGFLPKGRSPDGSTNLTYDEYEVIRLLDYVQMTQEECARRMDISRPTVTRIYNQARQKMADMLVNARELTIGGGDVTVCREMKPECAGEKHCCHRSKELSCGWRESKEPE
mgnify:CR=1 FL=1